MRLGRDSWTCFPKSFVIGEVVQVAQAVQDHLEHLHQVPKKHRHVETAQSHSDQDPTEQQVVPVVQQHLNQVVLNRRGPRR